jgi:hypothetical protein
MAIITTLLFYFWAPTNQKAHLDNSNPLFNERRDKRGHPVEWQRLECQNGNGP